MKSRATHVVSFVSGLVFAIGLGLSGMTRPGKVMAFLDVTGAWDPTLAFVMAGAIAVHTGFALRAKRAAVPLLGPRYVLPSRESLDGSLVVGAVLFGVGWGLQGYCPGPAVVAATSGDWVPIVFLGFMVIGFAIPRLYPKRALGPDTEGTRPEMATAPAGDLEAPRRDSPSTA